MHHDIVVGGLLGVGAALTEVQPTFCGEASDFPRIVRCSRSGQASPTGVVQPARRPMRASKRPLRNHCGGNRCYGWILCDNEAFEITHNHTQSHTIILCVCVPKGHPRPLMPTKI